MLYMAEISSNVIQSNQCTYASWWKGREEIYHIPMTTILTSMMTDGLRSEWVSEWDWLLNVTCNDISVIYLWRHIDVQADWLRSLTYSQAPNAIAISFLLKWVYDRLEWLLRWGFGMVPAIIYRCNAVPCWITVKRVPPPPPVRTPGV